MDWLSNIGNTIGLDIAGIGRGLVRIFLIVIAGYLVDRFIRSRINVALARRSFGRSGSLLVSRAISMVIFATCALMIFGTFGASWTGLLTVISASTVAIALAIQDVLKNFVSGIFLLLERPFRTGDHIKVRGVDGEVQGIDVRTTLVREGDGSLVMVPNSVVFTEVLTNRSRRGTRRMDLQITVHGASVWEAESRIDTALRDVSIVRRPVPAPLVKSSSAESTIFTLSVLTDSTADAERDVLRAIIGALDGGTVEVIRE